VAAHWYREAAKGGDVGAQYLIASMYEHGEGVACDLRLARYWYDIAAKNGDVAAPGKVRELDERLRSQGC
jgi:TPR repeat protein